MQQEIERKFLVINNIYKNGSVSTFYKQGYLCTDASRTVRIRIAGEKGFITIKGITTGCSRTEYEYEIPTADAMTLLDMLCIKPLIEKIRYRYKASDCDMVKLEINGALSPMRILPLEGESFLFLVLPVRVKNDD